MRNLIAIAAITCLSACAVAAPATPLAPKTVYRQVGATVVSPNEQGWTLIQSNAMGVAFARQYGGDSDSAVANTTLFRIDGYESDSAFLSHIESEREKQDDKSRFKILEVSNEQVMFKGTACLRYRAVSEDHKSQAISAPAFQYLKVAGYICRHPANKVAAFQMEISHRSRDRLFPEALLTTGEEFFNDLQFNDQGLK